MTLLKACALMPEASMHAASILTLASVFVEIGLHYECFQGSLMIITNLLLGLIIQFWFPWLRTLRSSIKGLILAHDGPKFIYVIVLGQCLNVWSFTAYGLYFDCIFYIFIPCLRPVHRCMKFKSNFKVRGHGGWNCVWRPNIRFVIIKEPFNVFLTLKFNSVS